MKARIAQLGILVGVTAAALGLSPQSANGDDSAQPTPHSEDRSFAVTTEIVRGEGEYSPLSDAALQDMTFAAKKYGVPLDQMRDSQRGVDQFSELMTKWEQSPADVVVRWGLPARGESGSRWVIATTANDELRQELASLPGDTELRTGAPSGQRGTELAASAAAASLLESRLVTAVRTHYDLDNLHAVVQYEATPDVDQSKLNRAIEEAWAYSAESVNRDLADGELQFEAKAGLSDRKARTTVQGGRALWLASGVKRDCTSGFAANRSTNEGLITAQHCVNTDTYLNIANVITWGANATSLPNALIDLQFMRATSGNDAGARFYGTGPSDDRYVTNTVNGALYSYPCKYGWNGGYDCGYIIDQNECYSYSTHLWCGQDESYSGVIAAGDSGGPWFNGNTANGVSASGCDFWACNDTFTRIGRASTNLQATVREQ